MTKPTIVLVPGAWHTTEIYSKVASNLDANGYSSISQPLPSAGAVPANTSFDEDVKAIRDCLTKLIDGEEKEVILVVHSYTGMPGAEAPKDLGIKERQAKGLKGGVVRLVFIMAFAMPEGFQPTAGGAQLPEWMKLDLEVSEILDWYYHRRPHPCDSSRPPSLTIHCFVWLEGHHHRRTWRRKKHLLQRPLLCRSGRMGL